MLGLFLLSEQVIEMPLQRTAVSRAYSNGVSKGPAAGVPVTLHSSKTHPRMATAARALSTATTTAPATPPDNRVTWAVEIITHIPKYDASDIGLLLTVISTKGERREAPLKSTKPPEQVERKGADSGEELPGRRDSFAIKLPAGFEPAAIWVEDKDDLGDKIFQRDGDLDDLGDKIFQRDGDLSRLFLKVVTLRAASSTVTFIANTYISTEQGERQFIRDDAFSNPELAKEKVQEVLIELMAEELLLLRGEGANQNQALDLPRSDPDRIYRYAIYNDLGGDVAKTPKNIRQPLGGSAEFPYPRRLDTNRKPVIIDGKPSIFEQPPATADAALVNPGVFRSILASIAEKLPPGLRALVLGLNSVAPVSLAATPWTPQDDNFDVDKTRGFIGNAVSGVLPGALVSIDAAVGQKIPPPLRWLLQKLRVIPGDEFDSVEEVLSLYDRGAQGPWSALSRKLEEAEAGRLSGRTGQATADKGGDVLDLLKYDMPQSLVNRLDTWPTDEEMGRMYLAGQNPLTIEVLDPERLAQLLKDSAGIREAEERIRERHLGGKSLEEWAAAGEEAGAQPRLFIVDYWAVFGLLDTLEAANAGSNRVMHAGRCVLFRRSDGHLVPVIIELAHSSKAAPVTYTASDPAAVWQVAKLIFQSVDSGWHQLVSHWLRTHACTEPFLIATRRQLPAAHPMFRLLMPHFRYTLPINAAARGSLINAGGVIETNFSPGPFSMQLSSIVYGMTWRFKEEGLTADLAKRGFLDSKGGLRIKDYPYAEDGLLLWGALKEYFEAYVELYYKTDEAVQNDTWLQAWWNEVKTEAHKDANASGWVDLDSRSNLVLAALTIAWVASAHHAAVNFGQYDYSGWMPSHSPLCRRPAPAQGSEAWQKLASKGVSSSEMFTYIAPPATATKVMSTVKLLSAHAQDEQYLSTNAQDWLPLESDARVATIFEAFVAQITKEVAPEIERRNADPANISRNPASQGMAYRLLYPSSGPGVTMQGVPYSISI
ncbi:hypothetical protein OEZ85_002133 [Tetradesmus obliquus]|uniref:Lipoxygenase n=1 Tax=Tetradesmus obliquus TaxID=3088 RepID=A0ABY8U687_TETOB|nr:hypothetical protein OEZ85_002133 [Tetradesmus obliquus]